MVLPKMAIILPKPNIIASKDIIWPSLVIIYQVGQPMTIAVGVIMGVFMVVIVVNLHGQYHEK